MCFGVSVLKRINKLLAFGFLILAFSTMKTLSSLMYQESIPTTGTITTVGVSLTWLDGSSVTTLDWGITDNATEYIMEPINITNTENTPATLALTTDNLSPSIISLSLTWNYTGAILDPYGYVIVELRQNIIGIDAYTYDTVFTATEV